MSSQRCLGLSDLRILNIFGCYIWLPQITPPPFTKIGTSYGVFRTEDSVTSKPLIPATPSKLKLLMHDFECCRDFPVYWKNAV